MKLLKRNIRRLTRWCGYEIVPYQPASFNPQSYANRRNRWFNDFGISLLFDVGANAGQYAREVRQCGYKNRIVSFEPMKTVFEELQHSSQKDTQWQCLNIGIGETDGMREIHIAGNSGQSSSLLPMHERHVRALPISAYVGAEKIQIVRLDSIRTKLTNSEDSIWLKIDVQGYEHKVLDGASELLGQIKAIELEMSLVSLYEGAPLLCDTITYLSKKGFQLIAVEEAFQDTRCAHTLQLNGIFERIL